MRKYQFLTILFCCLTLGARGLTGLADIVDLSGLPQQTETKWVRYWFDNDDSNATTTTDLTGSYNMEISSLCEGVHIMHFQAIDDQGVASIPSSKIFLKPFKQLTTKKVKYWFDDDSNITTTEDLGGIYELDVKNLVEGIHVVHYQTIDNNGAVGSTISKMFMKLSAKTAVKVTAIRYWFDERDALVKEESVSNMSTSIDASGLALGKHILHYQLKLSDGTLAPAVSATFETTQTLEGDANNDKKVNVADIVTIQIFIDDNAYDKIHGGNADANGDNVIDEKDVEEVQDLIFDPGWTKVGTGTFTYNLLWNTEVKGYRLYKNDNQPNLYKIRKWGNGTPVDYIFIWNKETNVCATQKGLIGYYHSAYGTMSVGDVSTYTNSNYTYENYPSRYVSEENTFYFYNAYFTASGSFLGLKSTPEKFVVEWFTP